MQRSEQVAAIPEHFAPRRETPFPQPERAYTKPVILLINSASLSDGLGLVVLRPPALTFGDGPDEHQGDAEQLRSQCSARPMMFEQPGHTMSVHAYEPVSGSDTRCRSN